MAFAKMLIFSFSLVGIFALLFASIPGDFFTASYDAALGQNSDIADRFNMANVTLYADTGSANMTHPYSSYHDEDPHQFNAGLPEDQYIEVYWGFYLYPYATKVIQFRHIQEVWWGLNLIGFMKLTHANGEQVGDNPIYIAKTDLLAGFDTDINGTAVYGTCNHAKFSTIFTYNQSKYTSIGEAWDSDELGYYCSFEPDMNRTGVSAWTVLGQLLTFQNPDLGISGTAGNILNTLIAIPLWVVVAILIILLVQSMIPFISGLRD
jgi:hypothetical protein